MSAAQTENDLMSPFMKGLAPYFVLALAVFLAYGNIFDNEFLFDDMALIATNAHLRDWSHIGDILTSSTTAGAHLSGGFFRPLQMLLYLFAHRLGDGDVFWFHALNLALHIANACLVYKLGLKMGFDARGVFFAALIWALHPLHTEAVTYMSATADPLYALFCLWALIVMLPDFSPRKILLAAPLMLLGLASKETAVVLPPLAVACLFYASPARLKLRTYARTWPLWVLALAYTGWRWYAEGFTTPHTSELFYDNNLTSLALTKAFANEPIYRFFTFLATLPSYAALLVWPSGLHMERNFPVYPGLLYWPVLGGALIVLGALVFIVRSARARQSLALSWGLLWFAAAHAPHTGLFVLMNGVLLEHWMYLPSAGLFLGLGQTLASASKNAPRAAHALCAAACAVSLALGVATYEQNKTWRDHVSFYGRILSYEKNATRAHANLASYYIGRGDYDEAIGHLAAAIEISDVHAEARYNLASAYLHKAFRKQYPAADAPADPYKQPYTFSIPPSLTPTQKENVAKAVENLKRSVEIQPDYFRSWQTLGDVYERVLKDKKQAAIYHAKAQGILSKK